MQAVVCPPTGERLPGLRGLAKQSHELGLGHTQLGRGRTGIPAGRLEMVTGLCEERGIVVVVRGDLDPAAPEP